MNGGEPALMARDARNRAARADFRNGDTGTDPTMIKQSEPVLHNINCHHYFGSAYKIPTCCCCVPHLPCANLQLVDISGKAPPPILVTLSTGCQISHKLLTLLI